MRQTLFYVPHSWFEGPLLWGWLIVGLLIFVGLVVKFGFTSDSLSFLPLYLIGAAMLKFVVPGIEVTDVNPADPMGAEATMGLAVRGYGAMMLLGITSGVGLSMWRARREGISTDKILSLAFAMIVCGIVGARLFYVIQNREQYLGQPFGAALKDMLNMTQGGLVVYGSLFGAAVGGAIYLWKARLPVLKVADIVAPGMLVGLALGRIGCLMNGCCYGGACDVPSIAQKFPAGSPPYLRQLETGELLGLNTSPPQGHEKLPPQPNDDNFPKDRLVVDGVEPNSLAFKLGLKSDSWFAAVLAGNMPTDKPIDKALRAIKRDNLKLEQSIVVSQGDGWMKIPLSNLPEHSRGVYPTQIIASINAALLALMLWFFYPLRRRDGQVFALLMIFYSITRFLIELVRRDEYGQFGTGLTISQWVSVLAVLGGFALYAVAPLRKDGDGQVDGKAGIASAV